MSEKVFRFADGSAEVWFDNGDRYRGAYENGGMNGRGIYFRADGKIMEGQFENGLMNGPGVIYFNNLDSHAVLEGEFSRSEIHGPGKMTFLQANGTATSEGTWVHNHREGPGKNTYIGADGQITMIVEGEYHNDQYNGRLKKTWADGTSIEGIAKDGEFTGKVVYHLGSDHGDQEGWTYEGEVFKNQNSTYVRQDASAKNTLPDGTVYEGPYVENSMNGMFRITHPEGSIEEAEFVNGVRVVPAEVLPQPQEVIEAEVLPEEPVQPAAPSGGFCVNCGNKLLPGAQFCVHCGTKVVR